MLPHNKLTKEVGIIVHYGWSCRLGDAITKALEYQTRLRLLGQAESDLEETEDLLRVVESLPEGELSSQMLLQAAERQMRQAESGLESARQDLARYAGFLSDAVGHEATVAMMPIIEEKDARATKEQLREALAVEVPNDVFDS